MRVSKFRAISMAGGLIPNPAQHGKALSLKPFNFQADLQTFSLILAELEKSNLPFNVKGLPSLSSTFSLSRMNASLSIFRFWHARLLSADVSLSHSCPLLEDQVGINMKPRKVSVSVAASPTRFAWAAM